MTTTAKTKTTLMSKIRRALRELKGGQDAIFGYDREFLPPTPRSTASTVRVENVAAV